ncbi:unnamed protein product [Vitrella brassicaformis CCMP3155]|uniref:Uncharacterized protein n=1 Tax=Vitrella brassicaformis (strain CCMP3155) TaxID=1169540 RepID=A0A0G4GH82_VITBC|nr:unnamed protein product [Vitrella brassicaformis CCMP3155]|eukprot:CEM28836.1 unnamed protein product [Vitrella brassicaformis CCMP3155]
MLKTGDVEDDQLLSIVQQTRGVTVTMTQAAAKSLPDGENSTLYGRFTKYDPSTQCGLDDARRVVDIVVRAHQQRRGITAADVRKAMGNTNPKLFRWALDVFGIDADAFLGLAGIQHLQNIKQWAAQIRSFPAFPDIPLDVGGSVLRLYKASVDGWCFGDLLEAVEAHEYELLLLILRAKRTGELFASVVNGKIAVTGPEEEIYSYCAPHAFNFKLTGTAAHPHEGYIGDSGIHLAGLQEKLKMADLANTAGPGLPCVLCTGRFDIGIMAAGAQVPAAPADVPLKRCQASVHKSDDRWGEWERQEARRFLPVSELGFQFELDEMEVLKLS